MRERTRPRVGHWIEPKISSSSSSPLGNSCSLHSEEEFRLFFAFIYDEGRLRATKSVQFHLRNNARNKKVNGPRLSSKTSHYYRISLRDIARKRINTWKKKEILRIYRSRPQITRTSRKKSFKFAFSSLPSASVYVLSLSLFSLDN